MNKLYRPIKRGEKLLRSAAVAHVTVLIYYNPQHQSLPSLSYYNTNHCVNLLQSTSVSPVIELLQSKSVSHVTVLIYYNPQHQSLTSLSYVITIHISLSSHCVN
jgi:hypothetical protein